MFGNRLIKSNNAGAACTTDTVQILDGTPLESIATYQLDGAATSIPNNTYPGTFTNPAYAAGKFGQAAVFNGSSTSKLTTNLSVNTASSFSISAWIKSDLDNTWQTWGFAGNSNNDALFLQKRGDDNRLRFLIFDGGVVIDMNSSQAFPTGQWWHFAATINGSVGNLYINGVNVANNVSYTHSKTYSNFTFGQRPITPSEFFDGSLDQVRIFNTALSAGAVTNLYNETVATASNSYINVPSCIAYYKMSDATDETGSYDGTPTNVNFNVAGKFGNAGEFNGSSSKIITARSLPLSNGARTISAWVKTTATTSYNTILMYGGTGVNNQMFAFRMLNGQLGVAGWNADYDVSAPSIYDGNWHNVVATYDGSTLKLYADGQRVGSDYSVTYNTVENPVAIGAYNDGDVPFNGKIDQVRIFNRAITANEAETLYDEVQCIPTIVPTDNFNPVTYTGAGGTQSITSFDFQPDLVWIKNRDNGYSHQLYDSVRGTGSSKNLQSDNTSVEGADANLYGFLSSFDDFGYTVQGGTSSGFTNIWTNQSGQDYVTWAWKAGGPDVLNEEGTIDSQVSANVDAGFSVVSYTGNNSTFATIGHGLGQAPSVVIVKARNFGAGWPTMFNNSLSAFYGLRLNDAGANNVGNGGAFFSNTPPDSSVFTVGGSDEVNDGYNYIAYCFAEVDGFSKIGSYTGNGSTNGPTITTGFRPAFVMIKGTSLASQWNILDNKRDTTNPATHRLFANLPNAESTGINALSFLGNGFEINNSDAGFNGSSQSYIFMAFAEEVFVPDNFFNDDSTVATYKLDGDAGDDSGNGYNGIASNVTYAAGKFDEAAVFNGSNSKIDVSNFSYANSTFSISLWVNFNSIATAGSGVTTVLMGTFNGTNTNVGNIWVDSEKMRIHSNQKYADVTYSFNTNQWYQIGIVFETNGDFFGIVNGSRITPTNVNSYSGTNNGIRIGPTLNGKIDQVRIFNRALDSGEVTQLYNE